jgi:hypothetical protein
VYETLLPLLLLLPPLLLTQYIVQNCRSGPVAPASTRGQHTCYSMYLHEVHG